MLYVRTTSDLDEVDRLTGEAVYTAAGRVPVVAELSCYHPGSIQQPGPLVEAARLALGSGASAVGVYGSDAVEQLDLWDAIERMSSL